VLRVDSDRAESLGRYDSSAAAASTRCRVSGAVPGMLRSARDTVGWETPASRATSKLVTFFATG
jgi:hypothetical protein